MFLSSLLKSAANALLKFKSAVIAIAHILFVSKKSLTVSLMLLEYSLGKLKYDYTTLPMSGFLGPSSSSASRSPVSLAILNFFVNNFSVWVLLTHRFFTYKKDMCFFCHFLFQVTSCVVNYFPTTGENYPITYPSFSRPI